MTALFIAFLSYFFFDLCTILRLCTCWQLGMFYPNFSPDQFNRIISEFGGILRPSSTSYVSFDKEGAELLFSHLSLRSGSKATIITTNLLFTRWEDIMKDRVLCSALVDRLCHKAYLVNMTGKSYRIRETQNMFKK